MTKLENSWRKEVHGTAVRLDANSKDFSDCVSMTMDELRYKIYQQKKYQICWFFSLIFSHLKPKYMENFRLLSNAISFRTVVLSWFHCSEMGWRVGCSTTMRHGLRNSTWQIFWKKHTRTTWFPFSTSTTFGQTSGTQRIALFRYVPHSRYSLRSVYTKFLAIAMPKMRRLPIRIAIHQRYRLIWTDLYNGLLCSESSMRENQFS